MSRPVSAASGTVGVTVTGSVWPGGTFLAGLTVADRDALLALGDTRRHARGEILIREGADDSSVYLLLRGYVRVIGSGYAGRETLLALRLAGDLVGELAALDRRPRSATVIAAMPTVTGRIPGKAFRAYLNERPAVAQAVQSRVVAKFRQANQYRIDLTGAPAVVRLARVLERLATLHGRTADGGTVIEVPVSQADLATLAGASEPSVQRALSALRGAGLLSTGYRRLVVRDLTQLRRFAAVSPGDQVAG
jgi:CRP/FNR family cyclic AMP-dependent transcriptional regulator